MSLRSPIRTRQPPLRDSLRYPRRWRRAPVAVPHGVGAAHVPSRISTHLPLWHSRGMTEAFLLRVIIDVPTYWLAVADSEDEAVKIVRQHVPTNAQIEPTGGKAHGDTVARLDLCYGQARKL